MQIVDYIDPDPDLLEKGSIGLQLHWLSENDERSQRVRFRGLIVVDDPMSKELVTTTKTTTEMTKREETRVKEQNWVKSWRRKHLSCRCEEQCLGGGVARSESLNGGGGKHDVRSHVCLTYI